MELEYLDVVAPAENISLGGYWSGTEDRHHQHYLAIIPETRYIGDEPPLLAHSPVVAPRHEPIKVRKVKEWKEPIPKPITEKKYIFKNAHYQLIQRELYNKDIIQSVNGSALNSSISKERFIDDMMDWIGQNQDGYYLRYTPKINEIVVSNNFMAAITAELEANRKRLRAFLVRTFD